MTAAAAAAKSLQSCPSLCDPIDGSPPGSPVPGILQARTLEWVAISFSNAWKWKVKMKLLSRVRLLATPWTVVHQAPPSMGFSRQEYWSGVPLPSPNCFVQVAKKKRKNQPFSSCIYFIKNNAAFALLGINFKSKQLGRTGLLISIYTKRGWLIPYLCLNVSL